MSRQIKRMVYGWMDTWIDESVDGHAHLCRIRHNYSTNIQYIISSFFIYLFLPLFHLNAFKINPNLTKCKNNHATNAYFNNIISLLFMPFWSWCHHRNDNPCWDSVASSQQIWMLNPLAKHHSQSELAMINNPTREIWLGEMEEGDLREWVTAMSLLSRLSQIGNHTPRKYEMFICKGLCRLFKTWAGTQKLNFACMLFWHAKVTDLHNRQASKYILSCKKLWVFGAVAK